MNAVFLCASDTSYSSAALYSVVGFVIVLAVLALLVGIFYLLGYIQNNVIGGKSLKRKKKNQAENAAAEEQENDEQVVAAITAAISLVLSEESGEQAPPDFVIRRITRR